MAGENLAINSLVKGSIQLQGEIVSATLAGTDAQITVYLRDNNGDILYSTGTDIPDSGTIPGFAKGSLFVDMNVGAGTTGLYVNVGTNLAADFDAVSDA